MVTTSLNNIATLSALWTLMFMLFSGGFALSTMSKSAPQTSPLGDMLSQKVAATGGSNSLSLNSNSNSNNSPFKSNFLRKLSQQSRNVEENEISSSSNMNGHHNININNHNSINNNNNNNENESDQPPIVSNSNNSNNDQDILEHNGDEPGGGGGGGGGGGSDIISNDDSVFGNTGETFIDFGNRRTNELKNANKILFDKSMTQCPYAPSSPLAVGGEDVVSLSSNTEQQLLANDVDDEMSKRSSEVELNLNNEECVLASVTFDTMPMPDKTSDKLFMLDTYTVGILSSFDSSLRLYNLNVYARTFSLVRAKHFRGLDVPYDACADKFKHIYIVFPDVNKIAKYALNSTSSSSSSSSRSNRTQQMLIRELISVRDADFSPSTIACHDDLIYVGERIKNHIRVYDRLLRLVRIISLKGVIVSNHVALGVNQNVRVLMDGLDGLALWQVPSPTDNQQHQPSLSSSSSSSSSSVHHVKSSSSHHSHHRKKFTLHPEGNKATLCHFYTRMSCLDDVSVSVETPSNVLEEDDSTSSSSASTRSNIYVTDSCANEVRKFVFERGHKIVDESAYQFSHADGMPISAVANPLGHLFVLTDLPRRLLVIDQRECIASSDHHTHS